MTLDATVAGTDANSYVTVGDADAFAAIDLGRDVVTWNAAETSQKEAALQLATRDLDTYKRGVETRFDTDQALRFPRDTDVDSGGDPMLPTRLQQATFAQAKYRLNSADLLVDARSRRARGLSNFSDDDGSGTMSLHTEMEPVSLEAQILMDDLLGTPSAITSGRRRVISVPLTTITEDDEDDD